MDAAVRLRASASDSKQAENEDDVLRREIEAELHGHNLPSHRFVDGKSAAPDESLPLLSAGPRHSNGHATHHQLTIHSGSTHQQRYSATVRHTRIVNNTYIRSYVVAIRSPPLHCPCLPPLLRLSSGYCYSCLAP